jgi:transposase
MSTRIIAIGMDVHSTNYTLCAIEKRWLESDQYLGTVNVEPDVKNILKFIKEIEEFYRKDEIKVTCGYEAGGLGYTIQRELKEKGINCVIMAPTTMKRSSDQSVKKNDRRDARNIAELLIGGGYKEVYVITENDEDVKGYLRMRSDLVDQRKVTRQEISAFCLKYGEKYDGNTTWTGKHMEWLKKLKLRTIARETLDEYMIHLDHLNEQIKRIEERIEELSTRTEYVKEVKRLKCLLGIKTLTALSCIVEIGDFTRFKKPTDFAAFVGLVPGMHDSGDKGKRMPITKAGNSHLRKMLIESSGGICKGKVGYKSKNLKERQKGNDPKIIAYADKGNIRLRKRYYHLIENGKNRNVAKTAVARELACFIWGMMTDNIERLPQV